MQPEISAFELKEAIQSQKIKMVYQPLVNIHEANAIVGFEALVRLQSEQGSHITAETVVKLCEQFQLITQLTRCVISQGLAGFLQLIPRFPNAYIAINLSASDIDSDMIQYLWETMQILNISHSQVMIELTERVAMNEQASKHIKTLRAAGHGLSIDDFGSGSSNVRYLQDLTPDIVKIDKAFVDWSTN